MRADLPFCSACALRGLPARSPPVRDLSARGLPPAGPASGRGRRALPLCGLPIMIVTVLLLCQPAVLRAQDKS
ncbi:hypothetical protein, partial [Acetobacter sp.]|uniref:hypothetical protein n=1 Tax=Acetobacter sp. TaxID=440 RepID=UPI0039E97D61